MVSPQEQEETVPAAATSITPSGIEVQYEWEPKRLYRVRASAEAEWEEVPSVTTVLGVLDKPALPWWGMKVGVEGVVELLHRGVLKSDDLADESVLVDEAYSQVDTDDIVRFLTQQKLTVNHVLNKAGDRGNSVHAAFEDWANIGQLPHPEIYPETERGYIHGLRAFLLDLSENAECTNLRPEVMVGSPKWGYAGRYDLRCNYSGGVFVTMTYPKKPNRVEEIPASRLLLDLKTSSGVYESHFLQLEAYEAASIECGYEETDIRAVVRVTSEGQYEFVRSQESIWDFISVLDCYQKIRKIKARKR